MGIKCLSRVTKSCWVVARSYGTGFEGPPLSAYQSGGGKVYSLVARVPFTPVDLDIGRLARVKWDALTDRFRLWFIPKIEGRDDKPLCHFTLRKFDCEADVLVFMHVVPKLKALFRDDSEQDHFLAGVLSNDEVRARSSAGHPSGVSPKVRSEVGRAQVEDGPPGCDVLSGERSLGHYGKPEGNLVSVGVGSRPGINLLAAMKEGMGEWWEGEG